MVLRLIFIKRCIPNVKHPMRKIVPLMIGLTVALPALAIELGAIEAEAAEDGVARPRLVPGGVDLMQGDKRNEIVSAKGISIGTMTPLTTMTSPLALAAPLMTPQTALSQPLGSEKLAAGGYVAYSFDSMALSSSLRTRNTTASADVSALYSAAAVGLPGTAALTLGYDLQRSSTFSLNTHAPGLDTYDPSPHGASLSLSWNNAITPSLYLGGYASAIHATPAPDDISSYNGNAFRLGASLGVKF